MWHRDSTLISNVRDKAKDDVDVKEAEDGFSEGGFAEFTIP
jgi:hypothetical protein